MVVDFLVSYKAPLFRLQAATSAWGLRGAGDRFICDRFIQRSQHQDFIGSM